MDARRDHLILAGKGVGNTSEFVSDPGVRCTVHSIALAGVRGIFLMIFFLRVFVSWRTCGRFGRVREKSPTTFVNLIFNQYECNLYADDSWQS
jgi:hypothetical protein